MVMNHSIEKTISLIHHNEWKDDSSAEYSMCLICGIINCIVKNKHCIHRNESELYNVEFLREHWINLEYVK